MGEVVEDGHNIIVTDLNLDELDNSIAVYEDDDILRKSLDQESESCDIDETGWLLFFLIDKSLTFVSL